MRPVCVECSTELRPLRNGASVEYRTEGSSPNFHAGDLYECPCCGHRIVIGLATKPTDTPYGEVVATVHRR